MFICDEQQKRLRPSHTEFILVTYSCLFYLFQQIVQQTVSMEERVFTWENAFALQAMKETNVKLVSSISVCLLSLTSTSSVGV